jgi:hypothetical protein
MWVRKWSGVAPCQCSSPSGEVLEKTGEHYRPNPAEIACDLWRFQAALAEVARADDDETTRTALRRAVETYRGDLLSGVGYSWVEPVRQDLHAALSTLTSAWPNSTNGPAVPTRPSRSSNGPSTWTATPRSPTAG